MKDRMLQFFAYDHLPQHLLEVLREVACEYHAAMRVAEERARVAADLRRLTGDYDAPAREAVAAYANGLNELARPVSERPASPPPDKPAPPDFAERHLAAQRETNEGLAAVVRQLTLLCEQADTRHVSATLGSLIRTVVARDRQHAELLQAQLSLAEANAGLLREIRDALVEGDGPGDEPQPMGCADCMPAPGAWTITCGGVVAEKEAERRARDAVAAAVIAEREQIHAYVRSLMSVWDYSADKALADVQMHISGRRPAVYAAVNEILAKTKPLAPVQFDLPAGSLVTEAECRRRVQAARDDARTLIESACVRGAEQERRAVLNLLDSMVTPSLLWQEKGVLNAAIAKVRGRGEGGL